MRHLELTEGAPARPVRLTQAEADAVTRLELAVATRTGESGVWDVAASAKIGVARAGQLQITVRPKIKIERLIFLMGYAQEPRFWRNHEVRLDTEADLFSAVADTFARLAVKALDQGLLHGYLTVDDTLPVLRGRMREGEQIGRYGLMIPLEVRFDEFTVDIAENRILLAAVNRLLRLPGISHQARRSLLRLRLQLADVTDLPRGSEIPRWHPSRLNTRYHTALRFAEIILSGNSFEQRVGALEVSGFIFDMWRIFEDFVCVALREAMSPYGGRSELQHRTHLDRAGDVGMRPDLVWSQRGRLYLVADAKYKAEKPAGFPQADLYQLLAYCTVLGLTDGHLVYAKGEEIPRIHLVTGSPVRIHCHTLDLEAQPAELLMQVDRLAARMMSVISATASSKVAAPVEVHGQEHLNRILRVIATRQT